MELITVCIISLPGAFSVMK